MSASFSTVALGSDLAAQTLPLVQVTWPAVDLIKWQDYVQFFSIPARPKVCGMHGLRDSWGCFCGVFAYQLDHDLVRGPVLAVHLFTAIDIINSPRTIQALLATAEARALELGCAAVQIRLHAGQGGLAARLRSLGLAQEITQFSKTVGRAANPS